MTRLTDTVDGVTGADTHRDTLAAAATDRVGGTLAQTALGADGGGYQRLLDFAQAQVPGPPRFGTGQPGRWSTA